MPMLRVQGKGLVCVSPLPLHSIVELSNGCMFGRQPVCRWLCSHARMQLRLFADSYTQQYTSRQPLIYTSQMANSQTGRFACITPSTCLTSWNVPHTAAVSDKTLYAMKQRHRWSEASCS